MGRRRETTIEQDLEIRRLVNLGITSPARIHRHLKQKGFFEGEDHVHVRTVGNRVREYLPQDQSGAWSLLDADADEAQRILPVAQWLVSLTGGRVWLSRDLADWVDRVSSVVRIPPNWAWSFARAYQSAHARQDGDVRCLDLALWSQVWDISRDRVEAPVIDKQATLAAACQRICGTVGRQQWDDLIATFQALPFSDFEVGPLPDPWEDAEPDEYAELFDDSEVRGRVPQESLVMNSQK